MSTNIKVNLSKNMPNSKLETLLNSYTSLKSILSPNLSENNNTFMNCLMDLIISQLQIFLKLLSLNEGNKIYEFLNSNNQYLSKQIANLYDIPRYNINSKISLNSTSEKDRNEYNKIYNKKESYSLEEKIDSFHGNNSDKFEFDFNKINTESRKEDNDVINEIKAYDNNINKEIKFITPRNLEFKEKKDKFIKINKPEKGKNDLIKSLNFNNKGKSKEKNIKIKPQKSINKIISNINIINNKQNKTIYKKSIISPINSIRTKKYINLSNSKKFDYPSFNVGNNNFTKNNFKGKNKKSKRIKFNKENNKDSENQLFSKNKKEKENENNKEKKFKRKERKSKTVIYRTIQLPFIIDIIPVENDKNNNGTSITFSNQILQRINTPKALKHKQKSFDIKNIKNKTSKSNTNLKKINKPNLRKIITSDYFSLDSFLIPKSSKDNEILFFTKNGDVLLNKDQKDILEDYLNNYLFEEEDVKNIGAERNVKDKIIKRISSKNNKKFVIKGTSKQYNLQDVTEVLQILPSSFNGHIDDFYLRKKRASIFDRGIFKICHKVIDNYIKLEGKEDLFGNKKTHSTSKKKLRKKEK